MEKKEPPTKCNTPLTGLLSIGRRICFINLRHQYSWFGLEGGQDMGSVYGKSKKERALDLTLFVRVKSATSFDIIKGHTHAILL